jgi:hypothetical protein
LTLRPALGQPLLGEGRQDRARIGVGEQGHPGARPLDVAGRIVGRGDERHIVGAEVVAQRGGRGIGVADRIDAPGVIQPGGDAESQRGQEQENTLHGDWISAVGAASRSAMASRLSVSRS